MAEIRIKVDIPKEFKEEFELALAKVVEQITKKLELLTLQERLKSKEEKDLTDWSVKLGRKAKKGRFKRLLAELSPKEREEFVK